MKPILEPGEFSGTDPRKRGRKGSVYWGGGGGWGGRPEGTPNLNGHILFHFTWEGSEFPDFLLSGRIKPNAQFGFSW